MTIAEPELQDGDLDVIQHAVQLAKDWQITSAARLKSALKRQGYDDREVDTAVGF